jgi:hypothetical protein
VNARLMVAAIVATFGLLASGTGSLPPALEPVMSALLPACVDDGGDNCYWNASTRGNGQGASWVSLSGVVIRFQGEG